MAMKAGRVGVNPKEVDINGGIKITGITPEQASKIDKALVTPVTKPTEKVIVGIDTGNGEILVKIGTGLKLTGTTSPYTLELDTE